MRVAGTRAQGSQSIAVTKKLQNVEYIEAIRVRGLG